MTYHSKIHIKVSKFNKKLSRPNFCPFWTPVNFLKLMKPDLYNFFESSFWTPWWFSFLVYMPFSLRNSFVNKWYLVGVKLHRFLQLSGPLPAGVHEGELQPNMEYSSHLDDDIQLPILSQMTSWNTKQK